MKAKKSLKTTSAEAEMKKVSTNVRKALRTFGHEIPQSHMLHALASAQGDSNWHVFKSKTTETPSPVAEKANGPRILKHGDAPLDRATLKRIVESDDPFTVVLSVDMEYLYEGDIERLNDEVSERITGSIAGLLDIAYEVVPSMEFGAGQIPLKVSAGDVDFETIDFSPGELRLGLLLPRKRDVWVSLYDGSLYSDSEGRARFTDFSDSDPEPNTIKLADQLLLVAYDEDEDYFRATTFDQNVIRPAHKQNTIISMTLPISAETHSDDRRFEIDFDARKWFEQASEDEILKLAEVNFGGDYPADDIAQWMASTNPRVRDMFKYISVMDDVGYEVHVDEDEALAWLRSRRPGLFNRVLCVLHQIDLVQAQEPEIAGRWDWICPAGEGGQQASDMSFETVDEAAKDAVDTLGLTGKPE